MTTKVRKLLKKVNKNRYHEKCNHYNQNERCTIMTRVNAKTINTAEMITIRFSGWISGRIVSLQPDTDIQKLLSNVNRIRIQISEKLLSMFRGFRLLENLLIGQSFIYYFQKRLFSLLCHDSESVYGVISVP